MCPKVSPKSFEILFQHSRSYFVVRQMHPESQITAKSCYAKGPCCKSYKAARIRGP